MIPGFVEHPDTSLYFRDDYLVLDVETTNKEHGTALNENNSLLLACWRAPDGTRKHKWGGEFEQAELVADIGRASFVVCHYTKFELQWLKRMGVDLRRVLPYCTLIGEKVIAGNRKFDLSLDGTAQRRRMGQKKHAVATMIELGVCPSEIPEGMLLEYCNQDVTLTERIFLEQRDELSEAGLLPVFYCRNLVTPALADIEFNGMTLVPDEVKATYEEYEAKYAALERDFNKLTGGINPRSGKQMREYLYDKLKFKEVTNHRGEPLRTAGGKPRSDKKVLPDLKATTDEQKEFKRLALAIAELKVPVQNLKKMHARCKENPNDPRMFAIYNQTVTQTDRLSSTGRKGSAQFHNIDRAFKKLFRARKASRVICEADAPQLEFRVAAHLGHDRVAISDICEGVDIHAATASTLGVSRQNAKAFTFRPLYGGSSGTPRERKYFDYFRKRYSGIYRHQTQWTMECASNKFLVTPWGWKLYFPDCKITSTGYVTNTTQIFNYPIQSLATADIIPLVLVLVWHSISELGDSVLLVNTIHDSIISECEPESLDSLVDILVDCFTTRIYHVLERLYGIKFSVPLGVGIKAGPRWGSGEERKFEPAHEIWKAGLQADSSNGPGHARGAG